MQETIAALSRRIEERFPGSGLSRVARELLDISGAAVERSRFLQRPLWPLRIAVGSLIVLLVAGAVLAAVNLRLSTVVREVGAFVQTLESTVNDLVFAAIAIFFLLSVETRVKRRRALRAIHELRSIAQIVDMHQLTKDPSVFLSPVQATASSPRRRMTRQQPERYLD